MVFTFAQRSLWETHLPDDLRRRLGAVQLGCLVATGCGEAADIVHGLRNVAEVSLHEIEQMYLLKTTRYTIECPLAMAAILTGAGTCDLAVLANIARSIGLAFQIQNDLQEFARSQRMDAGASSDFLEGKKTLLLHVAFSRLNASDRTSLQTCPSGDRRSTDAMAEACDLVVRSGAIRQLTARMTELFSEAGALTQTAAGPFFDSRTGASWRGLIEMSQRVLASDRRG